MKRESIVAVRSLFFAVAVIATGQLLAAQDFTVRMKDQDGKTAIYYVSRNAVRSVASNPVETDVIYRLDTGKIIRLNHPEKTYSEITLAQARQRMEKNTAASPQQDIMRRLGMSQGASAIAITDLGPGEAIAGYATEKYSTRTPITQGEIWVAPELQAPPAYYEMSTAYAAAQMGSMGQMIKEMRQKQIKGFLLKMAGTASNPMMKGVGFTQVATSVERAPIPEATFEPPSGYRKVADE